MDAAGAHLLQVLADGLGRLQAVADGHVKVHDDQVVGGTLLLEALLDEVYRLLSVKRHFGLDLVLVEDAGERVRAVEVVLDNQDFCLRHYLFTSLSHD